MKVETNDFEDNYLANFESFDGSGFRFSGPSCPNGKSRFVEVDLEVRKEFI